MTAPAKIYEYGSLQSTNDTARELALTERAPHGVVVFARRQTAGRGRHGNIWQSGAGDFHASLILREYGRDGDPGQAVFLIAVAAREALEKLGVRGIKLKWPNDLLLNGKKCGGILLEWIPGQCLIAGIGVNLYNAPSGMDYPATSLQAEGAGDVSAAALLSGFIESHARWHSRWMEEGFAPVRAEWLEHSAMIPGVEIIVRGIGEMCSGTFHSLAESGALMLSVDSAVREIRAGAVFFGKEESHAAGG